MAHFAKVLNGTVINIIVAEQEYIDTFIDTSPGDWYQTSINTKGGVHYNPETGQPSDDQTKALRKNFASLGGVYDSTLDAFYTQKPYPSWVLDEETCLWNSPVERPIVEGKKFRWDEETLSWIE
jgi:hypothetical protein